MSSLNARLIKKDILADVPAYDDGDSEVIDLVGVSKFSCQAVYDVLSTAKTFDSGGAEIDTFTFQAVADTDPGDYMVVYDTAGLAWAAAADITGSDPEPTGDVWVSIPAGRKVMVDLSGETTAAEVATAFATALTALVGIPISFNDSTADVIATGDLYGVVTAPEVHNEDDSGAGSIAAAVTDAGVASEVDVDADSVTIPSHGLLLGTKGRLTTTGTLPAGLATGTDYWIIVVDDNTVQFAASLDDALDGIPVDITDQGSDEAVNTFTPTSLSGASITFQKSNDGTNWINIQSATTITVDGTVMLEQADVSYRYFKAVKALSAGTLDLQALLLAIGPAV